MAEVESGDGWTSVIARSLAFLCLHYGDMRDKTLLDQAEFLDRLGMPRADSAALLGTSERSLRELARQREARAKKATQTRGAKG